MNQEAADKIMDKIEKEWAVRYEGYDLSHNLNMLRLMLLSCPDEDGFKRVTLIENGKTYLVPYEDIILNGLKGDEIASKYEEEKR